MYPTCKYSLHVCRGPSSQPRRWWGDPQCLIIGSPCSRPRRIFHAGIGFLLSKRSFPSRRWADFAIVGPHMPYEADLAVIGFSMSALPCLHCTAVCHTPFLSRCWVRCDGVGLARYAGVGLSYTRLNLVVCTQHYPFALPSTSPRQHHAHIPQRGERQLANWIH